MSGSLFECKLVEKQEAVLHVFEDPTSSITGVECVGSMRTRLVLRLEAPHLMRPMQRSLGFALSLKPVACIPHFSEQGADQQGAIMTAESTASCTTVA